VKERISSSENPCPAANDSNEIWFRLTLTHLACGLKAMLSALSRLRLSFIVCCLSLDY
jgi:hypothetical protein